MIVLWSIVILIAANVAAIAAMLLVRRGAPEGSRFKDGDRASGVFGVLAGGFAIFAGFIIFLAFTTYDQSRSGGEAEALTVVQQFETAEFLPAGVQDRIAGEIVCYGRSVVHREWPQMEDGKGGDTINPWAVALFRSLKLANPTTPSEQAAYGKWLDQTSDREEGRRDRLHGAEGIIPTSIWLVLFLIAGVVFAFMLFFADSGEGVGAPGDADGIGDHGDRADAAGDQRARQPVPATAWGRSNRWRWSGRCGSSTGARRRERHGSASVRRARRSGRVLMDDATVDRRFELAATVLLAMAAVATAWAAYQSARWHGEQAKGQSASIAARVESTRAADVANRQAQIDVALFTQWVDAYARDETELARFYRKRFRAEFRPAFVAWVATKPRTNPDAPLSPFAMPQYKLAATAQAEDLEAQAAAASASVGRYIQRADNYSLAVVLFAASLFFAGISTRLQLATPRMVDPRARLRPVPRQP